VYSDVEISLIFLFWTTCRKSSVRPLNRDRTCQSTSIPAGDNDLVGGEWMTLHARVCASGLTGSLLGARR